MTLACLPDKFHVAAEALQTSATRSSLELGGPVFERVDAVLSGMRDYQAFRSGQRTRAEFAALLEAKRPQLVNGGVPPNDVHFAKRYPRSPHAAVEDALRRLSPLNLDPLPTDFHARADKIAAGIAVGFDHQGLGTYIYPEEGRILLAAAMAFRPRRVVFLGSYYGYWAAWALPALAACDGNAVLVDPDVGVCAVARQSLLTLYPLAQIEVITQTGEDYLADVAAGPFDFVVLDAELPRTHPIASYRGKGVYAHLMRAVLPRLAPRSLLVCHNILLNDHSGCTFFDEVIARNREELGPFLELVAREYGNFIDLPTTEGVGIGLRE